MQPFLFLNPWVKGRKAMNRISGDKELQKRIRAGKITQEDVTRRLAELAFGKANDCVRLALEEKPKA